MELDALCEFVWGVESIIESGTINQEIGGVSESYVRQKKTSPEKTGWPFLSVQKIMARCVCWVEWLYPWE